MIALGSQRYRLTAVIFTLVAVLVGLLLWVLTITVERADERRMEAREEIFVELIAAHSRRALLINEYGETQIFVQEMLRNPYINKIILADHRNRIVVSTDFAEIGEPFVRDQLTATPWRIHTITDPAGIQGTLAILFSRAEIAEASKELRRSSFLLALPVLLSVAGVAWLLGSLLSRRFERLTTAAQQVAAGNLDTRVDENGTDEIGRLGRMFNTMTDSLQLLFSALAAGEARLNEAQQITHIGSWEHNCTTDVLWWSPEVYRLLELAPEQFSGTFEAFLGAIHPDDRARVHEAYTGSVRDNTPYDIVHRLLMADGRIKFVQERGQTFYDSVGTPLRTVGTVQDITDRLLAEEDLLLKEAAMSSAISGIAMADMERKLTYVNAAWLKMHGYTDAAEVAGTSAFEHVREPAEATAIFEAIQAQGFWRGELICLRRDGSVFPAELACNLVRSRAGEPSRFLASFQDISERKRAEEEKEELAAQLRQAQKMESIGTLAGGIAHDFNNILAVILGYAELAKIELPQEGMTAEYLDQIITASTRAKDLVSQILAFSRKAEQPLQPMLLQPLIKEAAKLLRASIPSSISINLDLDPECPAIIANPTQSHQVLVNLCTNAAQAMEEKGGRLEIGLKPVEIVPGQTLPLANLPPGVYVRLQVADTGPGMDSETRQRIFEPYFTTKKQGKGSGLGLAVVHGIVKGCGGGITVQSEVGHGTVISAFFPVALAQVAEEKIEPVSLPKGNERILLVDDEPMIVAFAKRALESLGYRVTATGSSLEALALFRADPAAVDLVVTDQTMPDMLGTELAKAIVDLNPQTPVILCTGYSSKVSQESAEFFGVKEFAMKPLTMATLAVLVRKALDG